MMRKNFLLAVFHWSRESSLVEKPHECSITLEAVRTFNSPSTNVSSFCDCHLVSITASDLINKYVHSTPQWIGLLNWSVSLLRHLDRRPEGSTADLFWRTVKLRRTGEGTYCQFSSVSRFSGWLLIGDLKWALYVVFSGCERVPGFHKVVKEFSVSYSNGRKQARCPEHPWTHTAMFPMSDLSQPVFRPVAFVREKGEDRFVKFAKCMKAPW